MRFRSAPPAGAGRRHALLALLIGGCLLCGADRRAEARQPERVLPPGLEGRIESLLGTLAQTKQLPGGWRLGSISIEKREVRYRFERADQRFSLVLRAPQHRAAFRSRNFSISLAASPAVLSSAEKEALLQRLAGLIQQNDSGPSPWKTIEADVVDDAHLDGEAADSESAGSERHSGDRADARRHPAWYDLAHPTRLLQALMLLVLLGLGFKIRWLVRKLRAVGRLDLAWLGAVTLIGLALRGLVGPRVPAWIYNHGYELLDEVFLRPPPGADPHGNAYNALHGLVLAILPRAEWVLLATQTALSVATIPLVYLVGRAWLDNRGPARWAALVAAVLPVSVYFAGSEVRTVCGTFFLLASLAALGWCIRDAHPVPRFVAAALAVITTQAYPTLMVVPLVLALFVWTAPGGRRLLGQAWSWAAAAAGLALYCLGAVRILSQLIQGSGIHGPDYLHTLTKLPSLLAPGWSFAKETSNVWLNLQYTPPLFWLCALAALVAAACRRAPRGPVVAIGLGALLLTLVGMVDGRMNTARVQLPAQALYCLLAGVGLYLLRAALVGLLDRAGRRGGSWALIQRHKAVTSSVLVTAMVGLSVALWPGPIVLVATPQRQHRFIAEGLSSIRADCTIVHPANGASPIGRLPRYLKGPDGRRRRWRALGAVDARERLSKGDCLIYYRPADCYEHNLDPKTPVDAQGLVEACARAEGALTLRPLLTMTLDAIPDNEQRYTRRRLPIGFFTIEAAPRFSSQGRPDDEGDEPRGRR